MAVREYMMESAELHLLAAFLLVTATVATHSAGLVAILWCMTTYATMGAGGLLLNREWRLIGGIEALTGILMVGWSVAVLVRLASWVYDHRLERWKNYAPTKEEDIISLY